MKSKRKIKKARKHSRKAFESLETMGLTSDERFALPRMRVPLDSLMDQVQMSVDADPMYPGAGGMSAANPGVSPDAVNYMTFTPDLATLRAHIPLSASPDGALAITIAQMDAEAYDDAYTRFGKCFKHLSHFHGDPEVKEKCFKAQQTLWNYMQGIRDRVTQ